MGAGRPPCGRRRLDRSALLGDDPLRV